MKRNGTEGVLQRGLQKELCSLVVMLCVLDKAVKPCSKCSGYERGEVERKRRTWGAAVTNAVGAASRVLKLHSGAPEEQCGCSNTIKDL